jgi:hypothetical protein
MLQAKTEAGRMTQIEHEVNEKGGKAMTIRKGTRSAMILGFLALSAQLFALAPISALAGKPGGGTGDQCYNQPDSDQDGFCDAAEGTQINVCGQNFTLNPNKKDVFVLLIPAAGGYIASIQDPFVLAQDSTNPNGGLPIEIHRIVPTSTCNETWTREIPGFSQKALRIQEDLSTSVTEIGISTPGLPSGRDDAKIYTKRIWQKIIDGCPFLGDPNVPSNVCPANTNCDNCTTNVGIKGMAIFPYYIQSTIAHEMGHMLHPLAQPYSRKIEYHDPANSGYIMDQFYIATTKSGVITIPVSDHYNPPDVDLVDFGSLMP